MIKEYYEVHITMLGDKEECRKKVAAECNWKFSAIDGDPVMGEGIKCYATRFFHRKHAQDWMIEHINRLADKLKNNGVNVIRCKIERVVYDDRIDRAFSCNGACPECHLDDLT